MRLIVLGLFLLLCFAAPGWAESGEMATAVPAVVLTEAVAEAFSVSVFQQAGAGKADWQQRLDLAQAKRSKGIRYVFVGLGMGVGGTIIAAAGGSSYSVDRLGRVEDSGGGLRVVGALTALGGAGVFWYGIYNWLKGGDEVDNLDREGRSNGWLTLVPTDGGVRLAMNFSF